VPACSLRYMLIGVGIALVAASGSVWADYKQDYARGQEAASDGNWTEVERYMREAMSGSSAPALRVRLYGQRFAPYVPQYYLGLAAFRTNDCAEAMRWFNDPQAAGVIAQIAEFKGVADDARAQCKTAPPVEPKPLPPVSPPVAQNDPKPAPPPVKPTPPPVAPPKPPVNQNPPVQNPPVASVPAVVTQTLTDYLAGRFSAASRASVSGVTGKAKAHLHLLRAASLFALSETAATGGSALRTQSQQDVRLAKQASPGLTADAQFFSPRFRAFFQAN